MLDTHIVKIALKIKTNTTQRLAKGKTYCQLFPCAARCKAVIPSIVRGVDTSRGEWGGSSSSPSIGESRTGGSLRGRGGGGPDGEVDGGEQYWELTEVEGTFKEAKPWEILVKGVESTGDVRTVEAGDSNGGEDDGNGGGGGECEVEDEEEWNDEEAVAAAATEEGLVKKLKASGGEARGDTGGDVIPPSSVLILVGWERGERGGSSGDDGSVEDREDKDDEGIGDGDEQTTCVIGALERLGATLGEVGTATFEGPETKNGH